LDIVWPGRLTSIAGTRVHPICLDDFSLERQGKSCFHPLSNALWWLISRGQGAFLCMYADISKAGRFPTYVPKLIKATAALCVSTFVAVLLVAVLWCRPLSRNWWDRPFSHRPSASAFLQSTLTGIRSLDKSEYCSVQTSNFGLLWVSVLHLLSETMGILPLQPIVCF